jgi:orotidine-5'-phosphate decarboxylase
MRTYNPIIVALDFNNLSEADAVLSKVRPHIGMIKVGLELYTSVGRESLSLARQYNLPVFLDLKLCDTPSTVKKTMDGLCGDLFTIPGNHFISIHCFGGREMCKAALEVTRGTNVKPAGVTLLTSFDGSDLGSLGFTNRSVGIKTVGMARLGMGCVDQGVPAHPGYPPTRWNPGSPPTPGRDPIGLDTFICAPAQLALMRKHYKDKPTLISPGIRMEGMDVHDHKNAKPASFALRSGADWLVIGRPITQASDPASIARHFEKIAEKY